MQNFGLWLFKTLPYSILIFSNVVIVGIFCSINVGKLHLDFQDVVFLHS